MGGARDAVAHLGARDVRGLREGETGALAQRDEPDDIASVERDVVVREEDGAVDRSRAARARG